MARQLPKTTFYNTRVTDIVNDTPAVAIGATATITGDVTGTVIAVSSTGHIVTVQVGDEKIKFTYSAKSRRFINMDQRTDRVATFA